MYTGHYNILSMYVGLCKCMYTNVRGTGSVKIGKTGHKISMDMSM